MTPVDYQRVSMFETDAGFHAHQPTRAPRRNRQSNRRGAILLLVAVSMIALMGVLVLALDAGLVQRQKRIAQLAADAAVKAGAIEIFRERTDSVEASARSEAARNGFTHGTGGRIVIVTYPSQDQAFRGANFVEVSVRDTVRTFFASIFGQGSVPVNARAIGGVTGTTQNCITTLNSSIPDALVVESGGQVTAVNCDVVVNSSSSTALCVTGGSSLGARGISVTGGYDSGCSGTVSPAARTGAAPAADPLASSVAINISDTAGTCRGGVYQQFIVTTDSTLSPGIYCGGIKVGKSTSIARFTPGTYFIKGGGLSVSGGGTAIGTQAAVVNLNAPAANGGAGRFDVIDFGSDARITWSAPTSGRLAGIAFYTPTGQGTPVEQNQLTSSGSATITGSLYFPDQQLRLGSGGTLTINGGIVARQILFRSDSRVNVTGFAGASPYGLRQASIVK